jgi:hypothetical protein
MALRADVFGVIANQTRKFTAAIFNMPDVSTITPLATFAREIIPAVAELEPPDTVLSATARDLIAQLPLTLSFRDFNGVEKIAQLPRKLSMDGAPAGDDPFPRDIGYYNPSGDLVFYYDGSVDAIVRQTGTFTAAIERVQ